MSEIRRWRDKDGNIKIHQVRTPASFDKTVSELAKYMEFLGIKREDWRLVPDTFTGRVVLGFVYDGVDYVIVSDEQTQPRGKPSIKDNARAIFHQVRARCLEMRKGTVTIETAFGGFVNWFVTRKLPAHMRAQLKERGLEFILPPPVSKPNQKLLEDRR